MDTQDYLANTNQNPTGLARRIWIQELKKFDTIATPLAVPVTPADMVKITADHTFPDESTTGWRMLQVHENTPEIETEEIGEDGSKTKRCKIMGFKPGWDPAFEAECSIDKSYLVLVERVCVDSGKYFQLGTACLGAKMKSVLKSGKTREGGRFGHEVEIESVQAALFEYSGEVTPDTTE